MPTDQMAALETGDLRALATGALRGLGRVRVVTDTPAPGRVELPIERFWALLRTGPTRMARMQPPTSIG